MTPPPSPPLITIILNKLIAVNRIKLAAAWIFFRISCSSLAAKNHHRRKWPLSCARRNGRNSTSLPLSLTLILSLSLPLSLFVCVEFRDPKSLYLAYFRLFFFSCFIFSALHSDPTPLSRIIYRAAPKRRRERQTNDPSGNKAAAAAGVRAFIRSETKLLIITALPIGRKAKTSVGYVFFGFVGGEGGGTEIRHFSIRAITGLTGKIAEFAKAMTSVRLVWLEKMAYRQTKNKFCQWKIPTRVFGPRSNCWRKGSPGKSISTPKFQSNTLWRRARSRI